VTLSRLHRLAAAVTGAASPRRLRIGFVGCGEHASANLYPCLPQLPVELVAVCARRRERAEATARRHGATAYDDFAAMFDREPLDAAIVCVGAREHFRICAAALERGLPVFVEKPATFDLAEARRLRELAATAGRQVMVGFQKRHAPAYRRAREIAAGFGTLAAVDGRFCVGPFRGGEAEFLREVAIHHLDLARFFAGDVAALHVERHVAGPDRFTLAIALRFSGGAVGSLLFSSEQSWRTCNERLELTGGGESVVVDNVVSLRHLRAPAATATGDVYGDAGSQAWEPNATVAASWNHTLHVAGFAPELAHFVACVRDGVEPSPGLDDFAAALELCAAINEA
jgi:myo-inositol 2-dehydrogenase/D-chiro-inositol 1-dehydrogenase